MKKNLTGVFILLAAAVGCMGELFGWLIPTLSWPCTVARELPFLHCPGGWISPLAAEGQFNWFGWLCMAVLAVTGIVFLLRSKESLRMPPEQIMRWRRFRSLRRGFWSLVLLLGIVLLAALDQCLVGKRALAVEYEGRWYFPAFTRAVIPGSVFGLKGNDAPAEANYRKLKAAAGSPGAPSCVIMPPIAYAPTMDVVPFPTEELPMQGGKLMTHDGKNPYNGLACRLYEDGLPHLRLRYRNGYAEGHAQGWDRDRREVASITYKRGRLKDYTYTGEGSIYDFLELTPKDTLHRILYHPAPPFTGGHLLGTNSRGIDILAYLYGGLQVNIKATLFYLPVIYLIGLSVGMVMGYFGGKVDLLTQRIIEVFSQIPFLFAVMILSGFVPAELRGMFLILSLLAMFGWMHITYLVRTTTMKVRARDYVAAAQVMGAGPLYIMRCHILPNLTGIIITLVPFSIASLVLALASLDYMGFGLPETYPGWGRLLNDGLANLSCPWVVSSAFVALVTLLLLVTFIGEGIREAFDPRRNTYYE